MSRTLMPDIAEAKRVERPKARARTGGQGSQIDGAEIVEALQKPLAQRDLLHVAELDDFLVDREEAFFEFEPIGKKTIFGAAVI